MFAISRNSARTCRNARNDKCIVSFRCSDTTCYHCNNTLYFECVYSYFPKCTLILIYVSFCRKLCILFTDIFNFLLSSFGIKVYLFEVYVLYQWNYSYTLLWKKTNIFLFLENSIFNHWKWFMESCLSVCYCNNKAAITTKFIEKDITIQTCDHNNKGKNSKSNTSMKSTHNSLQNDIFKNWTIFR